MRLMMFTKHLQELPLPQACEAIRKIGFAGADLTVRPGGYVAPEKIRAELPSAVQTCRDAGLEVPLFTTNITDVADPAARDTFESAAALGVREIKLGYWKYDSFGTFTARMDEIARALDGIEALALRTGVRANLHTHSAKFMTALAPVVWWLIKDRNLAAIGAYVDPGHMCVEGGTDGWRQGLDLLSNRIALVAIKDLTWRAEPDAALGKDRWHTDMVPLERGMVPWPEVFGCLRQTGYDGWLSFHSEYQGWHSWKELSVHEVIEQTRQDVLYLQGVLRAAGYRIS